MHEIQARHETATSNEAPRSDAYLAYGETLCPNNSQPSQLDADWYLVERISWPDARYLEITVVVSLLTSLMILCWLLLRIVF